MVDFRAICTLYYRLSRRCSDMVSNGDFFWLLNPVLINFTILSV